MNKILSLVALMASVSFGGMVTIDIPVSPDGWDHYKAALIGVDLGSYIADDQAITSAVLKFSGVQNYMEPETNDRLYIDLLKYNLNSTGQQSVNYYQDDQNGTNYFRSTPSTDYTWLRGKSDLGYYTDNNDIGAKEEYFWKGSYWEQTPEHAAEMLNADKYYWRYEAWFGDNETKLVDGTWYTKSYDALWSKYSGWTTEDFNRTLDVATVTDLMDKSNGWIGIGLDADCHYTGKLQLVIETRDVPEPTSLSLMLLGLTSLGGALFFRKRK